MSKQAIQYIFKRHRTIEQKVILLKNKQAFEPRGVERPVNVVVHKISHPKLKTVFNRIKTIVGQDAKPHQVVGRLLFYTWASNLPAQLGKRLLGIKRVKKEMQAPRLPEILPPAKTEQPLVSILIPTKNQSKLLQQCIDSILRLTTYPNYEILVIDNQSTDVSFFELTDGYKRNLGDQFRVVKADFTFNFSAMINMGAAAAKGEHLVLLNNDTQVITPSWLELLLHYSTQQRIGVVGCKLLYPDETIQHAGVVVYDDFTVKHIHVGVPRNTAEANEVRSFVALTAAAFMVKKKVFDEAGGFDELFRVEFNDIDFCLRLQELNYVNVYVPQVELFHYESASRRHPMSSSRNYKTFKEEQHRMFTKHASGGF